MTASREASALRVILILSLLAVALLIPLNKTAAAQGAGFGPGVQLVGTDISPGSYVATDVSNCFWERVSGFDGSFDSVIASDFISEAGQVVVEIAATDVGFDSSNCGSWIPLALAGLGPVSSFGSGTYLVGTQITPGSYVATDVSNCFWERVSGFDGSFDSVIASDFISEAGQVVVEIAATDVGFDSSNCGSWIPLALAGLGPVSSFGSGTYLVGTQITPGDYRTVTEVTNCYWETVDGLGGDFSLVNQNDFVSAGRPIVTITAQDVAFSSARCGTWIRIGGTFPSTAGSVFSGVVPQRLFDTRDAVVPSGRVGAGSTLDVQVAGVDGVPLDATAVVLNVTGTQASRDGFVTVWPSGEARPLASSLNLVAGQTAPNMVIVPIGVDGKVSFFSSGGTHLLADVAGFFTPVTGAASGGRLVSLSPTRLFDTRNSAAPSGKVAGGSTLSVQVAGQAGVPMSGASAVVMNVTGTEAGSPGFVTAFPSGTQRPVASVLNMERPGHTAANLVIVPIGADGKVSLYSSTGLHLLADVVGYITDHTAPASAAGLFVPVTPGRVFDTRDAAAPSGLVAGGQTITVSHIGRAGIPATGVGAVSINVTATQSRRQGFITAFPTGQARPLASVLNLTRAGETRPNAAVLPVGTAGAVSFFSSGGAHLLADANGYFTN